MTQGVFPASGIKPARGGILDAATVTEHPDSWGNWTNGAYFWASDSCPVDLILSDYCTNLAEGIIASSDSDPSAEGWPFGIITRYTCLAIGMKLDEVKTTALQQNLVGTQKGLEWELWTGGISAASGHLADRALTGSSSIDVTPGGAPVSVELGVAALEQALADCGIGAQGVIHMTRAEASLATRHTAISWQNNKLVTGLLTPVVAGVGYDPDVQRAAAPPATTPVPPPAPIGPTPLQQWMYATGPVSVHLGPSEIVDNQPIVHMATNEISVLAGRPAAIFYDACCTFAVNVDLEK